MPFEETESIVDVSVVIVTHNSRSVLEPCLESLKKNSLFGRCEVIIVDNASSDGTLDLVRERYPWVDLSEGERNAGFSVAVNIGIRRARGRYILILNPDTIVRERSIEMLVRFIEETPDAGIVAPKLVYEDGNLQYSCRRFYNWKVLLLRRTILGRLFKGSKVISEHLMMDYDHAQARRVDWVIGACMLVRREAIESVGLLDERFFLYFEDVDWCYRMKQKGWSVYYDPDATVVHTYARESAQSVLNRSFVAHLSSLVRYYEKWSFVPFFLKRYREVIKITLFLVADVIAFNLAFLSAYFTRHALANLFSRTLLPFAQYEQFLVYENVLFVLTFFVIGLYRIRRDTSPVDELFAIGKGVGVACVLLMASTYLSQIHSYSRMVVAFLAPYAVAYDWAVRAALRRVHRGLLAQRIDLKRVCIVGPAAEASRLERQLLEDAGRGIEVAGIVATDLGPRQSGERRLGEVSELAAIVDTYRIQQLIFLPGAAPEERIAEFIVLGRRLMLDVVALKDYTGVMIHEAELTDFAGHPAIIYRRDTRYAVDRLVKRLLDIVLGVCFLVVSLPCSVLYSLYTAIRGGTPYSRESRLGLRGKPFMYPVAGVRSSNGPSDIVNLPLFWLVVAGKLSVVGPYPLPTAHAAEDMARFRYDVRPGVTGLWRTGRDDEIPLKALLAQDAGYIRNWSLSKDLKILVATFGRMLMGKKRSLRLEPSRLGTDPRPE